MTVLMGAAGLAVDIGLWYSDKRAAQGAVDSAAYSAAVDYGAGDTAANVTATAKAITAQYGMTDGSGGVTVTVNQPPKSGPNTATAGAVEVIINKTETRFFASFFMNSAAIAARAVAVSSGSSSSSTCGVLALDTGKATGATTAGIDISNGATLDLSQCGVMVNATGADALYLTGGAQLKAKTVTVGGNYSINNGASMMVSGSTTTSASATADPYSSVSVPSPSGCTATSASYGGGGQFTISPGTYCSGMSIANGATVTMNPGVYIVNGGTFSLQGGATVNATGGVTIVLTGSGSNYATVNIANGTTLNLTAPTSGPTSGMAFFQDPNAPRTTSSNATDTFAGGTTLNITGALYFPNQSVNFSNGSSNASSCMQLIAWQIAYTGGSKFGGNCTNAGLKPFGGTTTALVE